MYGRLMQDDGGHWYLIPENGIPNFQTLIDKLSLSESLVEADKISEEIIEKYESFRLSGGIENLRIDMKTVKYE